MRHPRTRGTTPTNPALNVYRKKAEGLRVSAHVPDAVSGNKQNSLIRLGMERGAAVAAPVARESRFW